MGPVASNAEGVARACGSDLREKCPSECRSAHQTNFRRLIPRWGLPAHRRLGVHGNDQEASGPGQGIPLPNRSGDPLGLSTPPLILSLASPSLIWWMDPASTPACLPGGNGAKNAPGAIFFCCRRSAARVFFILDACVPELPVVAKTKVYCPSLIFIPIGNNQTASCTIPPPTPVSTPIVATKGITVAPAMIATFGSDERTYGLEMLSPADDR